MKNEIYGAILAAMLPLTAWGQSSCHHPTASEFKAVILTDVNMGLQEESKFVASGPVQIAVAPDGRVFIAKMESGEIRVYLPSGKIPDNVALVGTIPTYFGGEDGLLGIVLDPKFASNHWLYAFYSDPCGEDCPERAMELARFTITSDNKLSAKKVILRFPRSKDNVHHAAGGLAMDENGVLVVGTGDNTDPHDKTNAGYGPIYTARPPADAQRTASNTNDLRGKIIRIKPLRFADDQTPTLGIGATYDIPTGNLWEKINNKMFNPGWDATDSLILVRKEIFSFGNRNPYHVRVDSKSGWIFWGEVGPDAEIESTTRGPAGHDEWNLATQPGFFGHPYCMGYNVPWNKMTSASPATYGDKYSCEATVNNSPNNSGIHHMPPAVPSLVAYSSGNSTDDDPRFNSDINWATIKHGGETAIGGPMYRYNSKSTSNVKFPPYYEGKVLFFDWTRMIFRWITLNPDGTIPKGNAGVENFAVPGLPSGAYIDQDYGQDGAMYLLKFCDAPWSIGAGPQLIRVEYTGVQDANCYKAFETTVGPTALAPKPELRQRIAPAVVNGLFALPLGYRNLALFDLTGKQVWSFHRNAANQAVSVTLPAQFRQGLWQTKVSP